MRTRTLVFVLTAGICAGASAAAAQVVPEHATTTIRVKHLPEPASIVITPTKSGFPPASLKRSQRFFMGRGDVAMLGIEDPNPLVYEYSLSTVTLTPTDDFTALLAFAKLLEGVPAAVGGTATTLKAAAADHAAGLASASIDRANAVDKRLRDVGVDPETLASFSRDFAEALSLAKQVPDWIKQSRTNPNGVKTAVAARQIGVLVPRLEATEATIVKALQDLSKKLDDPALSQSPEIIPLLIVVSQSDLVGKTLELLRAFDATAQQIGNPINFPAEIGFESTNKQTVTLSIKDKDSKKTDAYEFAFEPVQNLTYGFGGAAVYSFVRKDDGTPVGNQAVPMLTIGSPRLSNGTLHMQIGVLPDSKQVSVFVGVGLKIEKAFAISFGWTRKDFDPTDERRWRDSVYLGVSFVKEK